MPVKSYKYRLSPTFKQVETLHWTLDRCRELYNAALQERRDAYKMCRVSINYYDQADQLAEIKELREEYKDIHSQVLQDVLRRVDKGMKAFFRRVKAGETPGYPRFQGRAAMRASPIRNLAIVRRMISLSLEDWKRQGQTA